MSKLLALLILAAGFFLYGCGGGGSSPSTAGPTVPPPPPPSANQSPTANAGADQNADEGTIVNLAGTGADADGNIVSFSWQQIAGTEVVISASDTANGSFIAPMVSSPEVLQFRFRVTDNDNAIGSDTVTIAINDVSQSGTADLNELISSLDFRFTSQVSALESQQEAAARQASAAGLLGSGGYRTQARSRLVAQIDSYFNFLYREAIRLTDNGNQFSRADIVAELERRGTQWRTYSVQFHERFGLSEILTDVVGIIGDKINFIFNLLETSGRLSGGLTAPQPLSNSAPTADAGNDQTVDEGTTVSLSGSGTDTDGFIASFSWQQDSGPAVEITDADMAFSSFVAPMIDAPQELIFRFVVTDNDGAVGSDTVRVSISNDPIPTMNQPPTADAGVDQTVDEGAIVSLFGAGADSDGTVISYSWEQDSGTAVPISGADTANASFTAPGVAATEELVFRLTVTDDDSAVGSDTVTITVNDVPPPTVNLDWSIELNDPMGDVTPTQPLLITGTLTNSPSSTVNLGVLGGFQGVPPGFDYEIGGFASLSSGYTLNWATGDLASFTEQFEGVNLAPGQSFDFEFLNAVPDETVTPGVTYTADLELQLFDAPRPGPMIGSSLDSVSWTVVDGGVVFVTNATFNGNLGGFQGADDKCNAEATAAGLSGTYVAWLSGSTADAKDRITDQRYFTVAGDVVATSLADLIDGTISAPINVDAAGIPITVVAGSGQQAWTNTTTSGVDFGQTADPNDFACSDWTSTIGTAVVGIISATQAQWTGSGPTGCFNGYRLYCFAQ
jgi:hypothetical protein